MLVLFWGCTGCRGFKNSTAFTDHILGHICIKSVIISSIVTESSTQGVTFATVTFGVGIDSL